MSHERITQQNEQFCVAFTTIGADTFGNGTKAYKSAYPDCNSENSASSSANRLLRKDNIQKRINELHEENLTRASVTVASVIADIRHDQTKARQAGHWSTVAQLDKMLAQYLSMLCVDNAYVNQPAKPKEFTPEQKEKLMQDIHKLEAKPQPKLRAV